MIEKKEGKERERRRVTGAKGHWYLSSYMRDKSKTIERGREGGKEGRERCINQQLPL